QAFGVMNFLTKPVDHPKLLALIRGSQKPAPKPNQDETTFFKAKLSRLTVLDIIQLKCLSNSSHALHFSSSHFGLGSIYFQNGEIVHAETARAKGMDALSEIIGWKGGRARERAATWSGPPTITGSWQSILLAAAQAVDETRQESPTALPGDDN